MNKNGGNCDSECVDNENQICYVYEMFLRLNKIECDIQNNQPSVMYYNH